MPASAGRPKSQKTLVRKSSSGRAGPFPAPAPPRSQSRTEVRHRTSRSPPFGSSGGQKSLSRERTPGTDAAFTVRVPASLEEATGARLYAQAAQPLMYQWLDDFNRHADLCIREASVKEMSTPLVENVPDSSIRPNICTLSGKVEAAIVVLLWEHGLPDV